MLAADSYSRAYGSAYYHFNEFCSILFVSLVAEMGFKYWGNTALGDDRLCFRNEVRRKELRFEEQYLCSSIESFSMYWIDLWR